MFLSSRVSLLSIETTTKNWKSWISKNIFFVIGLRGNLNVERSHSFIRPNCVREWRHSVKRRKAPPKREATNFLFVFLSFFLCRQPKLHTLSLSALNRLQAFSFSLFCAHSDSHSLPLSSFLSLSCKSSLPLCFWKPLQWTRQQVHSFKIFKKLKWFLV